MQTAAPMEGCSARPLLAPSSYRWRKMFNDTLKAVGFDQVDYRPYSLGRGRATHYFTFQGSFDKLLVLGSWQSSKTARIYVNEGLSVLTNIQAPLTPFTRNLRSQYATSLPQPLPKLDRVLKKVQGRVTWKKHQKRTRKKNARGVRSGLVPMSRVWPGLGNPLFYTLAREFGFGRLPWKCKLFCVKIPVPNFSFNLKTLVLQSYKSVSAPTEPLGYNDPVFKDECKLNECFSVVLASVPHPCPPRKKQPEKRTHGGCDQGWSPLFYTLAREFGFGRLPRGCKLFCGLLLLGEIFRF